MAVDPSKSATYTPPARTIKAADFSSVLLTRKGGAPVAVVSLDVGGDSNVERDVAISRLSVADRAKVKDVIEALHKLAAEDLGAA